MGTWAVVEQTIQSWVQAALPSGWTAIFAEQQGPALETSVVTIRLGDPIALGAFDELSYATNGGSAPDDLSVTANGVREFGVSLQAYGERGQTVGDNSPRAVLSLVRQSLEFPTIRYTLQHTAGLSPFDNRGPVRNVSTVAGTIFEPRALFELRMYVVESMTQDYTWIQTVDAGVSTPGAQQPIPGNIYGAEFPTGLPVGLL